MLLMQSQHHHGFDPIVVLQLLLSLRIVVL